MDKERQIKIIDESIDWLYRLDDMEAKESHVKALNKCINEMKELKSFILYGIRVVESVCSCGMQTISKTGLCAKCQLKKKANT